MMMARQLAALMVAGWLVLSAYAPDVSFKSYWVRDRRTPATGITFALALAAERPGHSPEVRRLLTTAKESGERELDVSWSAGSLGGMEGANRFEALFNRMYSTNIKVNLTPGPSMPAMAAKITQEAAAGQKASSDILLGTEGIFADIIDRKALEEYDYTKLSPRITKEVVAFRNIGVEIYSTITAILYNPNLVPPSEVPRKLEDVLNPKWKGKLASTPYAAYFDRVAMRPDWGAERIKAFVKRLSGQVAGLIRLQEETRIASGEFLMLVLGNTHAVRPLRSKGAPLGFVVPNDAASAGFVHLGVPRNSIHPNLGKLFINMIMSEEGQKTLYDVYSADHYALPGSQSWDEMMDLRAQGSKIFDIDVKFVLDHPEMSKLSTELQDILTRQSR